MAVPGLNLKAAEQPPLAARATPMARAAFSFPATSPPIQLSGYGRDMWPNARMADNLRASGIGRQDGCPAVR